MTERFPFVASKPHFVSPPKACDCHIHVFGPANKYPYVKGRTYTPHDAMPEDAMTMLCTLSLERVVLVQPSICGRNNGRMTDA